MVYPPPGTKRTVLQIFNREMHFASEKDSDMALWRTGHRLGHDTTLYQGLDHSHVLYSEMPEHSNLTQGPCQKEEVYDEERKEKRLGVGWSFS